MSQSRLSERLDEMKDEILEGIQKSVQIDSVATEAEENAPYGPGPKAALDFALRLGVPAEAALLTLHKGERIRHTKATV